MRTEDQREYARQWYAAHREEVKARSRNHYERNRERHAENNAAWKDKNREKVRELGRVYYHRHAERITASHRERRQNDEEFRRRYLARSTVSNAIRDGRLVRLSECEVCRGPRPEAHHDDYDRPLDVRWLCSLCHGKLHAAEP